MQQTVKNQAQVSTGNEHFFGGIILKSNLFSFCLSLQIGLISFLFGILWYITLTLSDTLSCSFCKCQKFLAFAEQNFSLDIVSQKKPEGDRKEMGPLSSLWKLVCQGCCDLSRQCWCKACGTELLLYCIEKSEWHVYWSNVIELCWMFSGHFIFIAIGSSVVFVPKRR